MKKATCGLLAAVFAISAVQAQDFGYSLHAGAMHSDNIGRTSVDEKDDTIINAGLDFGVTKETGRLNADVAADLRYLTYLDDSYDDEFVGGLDGLLTYWFLPERFSWVVQENFGQTFIDPRAVETPDNRQQTSFFSTGPDLKIQIGSRTNLDLQGRWSDASFAESNTDSQRVSGDIGIERELSARSTVSLNGSAERVEFDTGSNGSSFDRQSAYVGFDLEGARTKLSGEAGYTVLHDFGDTLDGTLLGISLTRTLSTRSALTLRAGTNLTDSAEMLRFDQGISGVTLGNGDTVVSADPFQSDYVSLELSLDGARSALRFTGDWRQEDHETENDLDRDSLRGTVTFTRKLGPTLSADLAGTWNTQSYDSSNVDFDEWSAGVGIDWAVARQFSLGLRADHFDGSGDTSASLGVRDYTENRLSVAISYTPRR